MADIYAVSDTFRRRMLAREADAARQMIEAYARLDRQLRSDITALAELLQARRRDGAVITEASIKRLERYRILQAQIAEEMQRLSILAEGLIAGGQAVAVDLGQESALRTTLVALPPGTTERLLADAGLAWNRLPIGALERMVGFAGDGSPLRALLDQIGPDVSRGVLDTLVEAVGRGYAPGKTAELVQQRVGMGLTRALRISRTEQLRAFRTASLDTYKANPRLVKGWRWVAAHSARTCAACLAQDGKEFELEVQPAMHVNDRCSVAPVTVSWRELGIPVDEPPRTRPTGAEWLAGQPEAVQRQVLGNKGFEVYKAGTPLDEFVDFRNAPEWGNSIIVKPIDQVGKTPTLPKPVNFEKPVVIRGFTTTAGMSGTRVYEKATQYGELVLTVQSYGGRNYGTVWDQTGRHRYGFFTGKITDMKSATEELARLTRWTGDLSKLTQSQSRYLQRRWMDILQRYGGSLSS